jgi:hypothetical protein
MSKYETQRSEPVMVLPEPDISSHSPDTTTVCVDYCIRASPQLPDVFDPDDRPKRPKRTWPGQGDDRAVRRRKQDRSGRRQR